MDVPMKMVTVNKFVLTQTVLTFVLVTLDTDYMGKDSVQVSNTFVKLFDINFFRH